MKREGITKGTEAELLFKSGRRCCLCYGLHLDFDVKRGQIAHINRDSSNSQMDNLAFLCLEHHDLYDSKTSQSKGFSETELRQYRNMLYEYVGNRSSSTKADAILKQVNDHISPAAGDNPTATDTTSDDNAEASAFNAEENEQKVVGIVDYITNSTEDVKKELTFLSDKLDDLQKEKESTELLGISGSVKAVDAEIIKIRSRTEICRERHSIIEAGYELWDRFGFQLTCDNGGFLNIWETIGEMKDGEFLSNPELAMRIPIVAHKYFREALDSSFFASYLVCLLYEDWNFEKLGAYCDYYLFATPYLDNNSLFLIATWNTNDLSKVQESCLSTPLDKSVPNTPPSSDQTTKISSEDSLSSGLILLLLLAQAYYKMLECSTSISSWCTAMDLELNESYFWTVNNIKNLLDNHEHLKDFSIPFEPLFSDLYPATIRDVDWDGLVAPEAELFLSTVQKYIATKGIHEPEEGTPAWVFIELFRPGINTAIERAIAYNQRMEDYVRANLGRLPQTPTSNSANNSKLPAAEKTCQKAEENEHVSQRDKVFISYSHKDKKFLDELLAHLKPLERDDRISAWSDQQIQPGSQWLEQIQKALDSTKVAVLLVTKDFLASDFIHQSELGPLLKAAKEDGVAIRWVLVRDCNWKKTPLNSYQAAYPTDKPLAGKTWSRDSAWVKICEVIEEAAEKVAGSP